MKRIDFCLFENINLNQISKGAHLHKRIERFFDCGRSNLLIIHLESIDDKDSNRQRLKHLIYKYEELKQQRLKKLEYTSNQQQRDNEEFKQDSKPFSKHIIIVNVLRDNIYSNFVSYLPSWTQLRIDNIVNDSNYDFIKMEKLLNLKDF